MRKKIVVANWKMNGSRQQAHDLVSGLLKAIPASVYKTAQVVICPPYVYLEDVLTQMSSARMSSAQISLGAQDVSPHQNGAYTGQISAQMLQDIGCQYVIVGHSERRQFCFEDNQLVAQKILSAVQADLTPILCVGETKAERTQGKTEDVVLSQVKAAFAICGLDVMARTMIAYEPIWAIGTGLTATPNEAQAVHALIRGHLADQSATLAERTSILYGGSVKASNSAELFSMLDIDGGLIGGASLNGEEFVQICESAARIAG